MTPGLMSMTSVVHHLLALCNSPAGSFIPPPFDLSLVQQGTAALRRRRQVAHPLATCCSSSTLRLAASISLAVSAIQTSRSAVLAIGRNISGHVVDQVRTLAPSSAAAALSGKISGRYP